MPNPDDILKALLDGIRNIPSPEKMREVKLLEVEAAARVGMAQQFLAAMLSNPANTGVPLSQLVDSAENAAQVLLGRGKARLEREVRAVLEPKNPHSGERAYEGCEANRRG